MNKKDFKAGIKAELKSAGFTENKLNTIVHGVEGTVIFFMENVLPESPLAVWLQDRFKWGVTIVKNGVHVNSPKQDNKKAPLPKLEAMKTKDGEAGRLNEPFTSPEFIPNKPQHAQGEWEYVPSEIDPKKYRFAIIAEGGLKLVADIYRGKETGEANAYRIVKAVNMHDKLKDALQMICKYASQNKFDMNVLKQMAEQGNEIVNQAEQK